MSISCRLIHAPQRASAKAASSTSRKIHWSLIALLAFLALGARAALAISITSFSPSNGNVGTAVTINGTGFSTTLTNDIVKFNGTVATVTSATTIKVIATVPSGASTGRITVTVSGSTATSSTDFTVKPQITSFSPTSGPIATPVTINGEGFSSTPANDIVTFHGTTAVVTAATARQITTSVPGGTTTGTVKVTVGSNSFTTTNSFTVTTSVTGFSPTTGVPGDSVIISGAAFSSVKANNTVKFNGAVATVTQATTTQLTATVPDDATTGPISVTVGSNTGASAQSFIVEPTIEGFYPGSGFVGDTIYLWGTGFGDAISDGDVVTVNGVTATIVDSTAEYSDLDFIVPPGAATGPIVLTRSDGGSATSDSNFVVIPSPEILSFSPPEGPVGTVVTIDGTNFDPTPDANSVTFNGVPGIVQSATETELHVTVPTGATTGSIGVGSASAPFLTSTPFDVTAPAPARALYALGLDSFYRPVLAAIDATTLGTFALISFADQCQGEATPLLASNHERSHIYYADCSPALLWIIDSVTNTIIGQPQIDDESVIDISMSPISSAVYVIGAQKVWVIDDDTGAVAASIDVASTLSNGVVLASALTRDGTKLYVRYQYYNNGPQAATAVIDTSTNSVVQTIDADVGVLDASGSRFYVGDGGNIDVWDIASDDVTESLYLFDCPPPPQGCPEHALALSTDGAYVYDAAQTGISLVVVDTATNELSDIPIDGVVYETTPRYLLLNAQGSRAYVSDPENSTITVVDTVHAQSIGSLPLVEGPWALGTDGSTLYFPDANGSVRSADAASEAVSDPARTSLLAVDGPLLYVDLASADRLSVFSVNGGEPAGDVYANSPFEVVVQTADVDGPSSVNSATTVSVALSAGTSGTLSGPTTCVIPAGGSVCTLRGLLMDTSQSNARLTVTAVSGDALSPANSGPFSVGGYPQPVILSFLPDRGPVGTSVTITGEHFHPVPTLGVNVAFNGTPATVTSIADGQLIASVPQGATTGTITVTVAGNTATSADEFVVMPAPVITITNITPTYSYGTDPIQITVTVTPVPPMTVQPTGTVTVNDVTDLTNNTSCVITLPDSSCNLIPPVTTPSLIGIIATYSGDATYGTATSAPDDHSIAFNQATIEITGIAPEPSVATTNPLYQGTGVFFRLLPVTLPWPIGYLPSGTIVVSDGTNSCLAYMPEGLDVSFCTINTPTPGVSTMTAYYSGDMHYATTQSVGVTHATSSPGGPFSLPAGTEICGFDPNDNPAYQNPTGFAPINELAGGIPSAGIAKDITGSEPLSVAIVSPAPGATTNENNVDVIGTFTGPVNTGIMVNGVVGYVTQDGSFLVPAVPLEAGTNTLEATATTLPGSSLTVSTTVVMTGNEPPIEVHAVLPTGIAPASVRFDYNIGALPNGAAVQSISVDYTDDGTADFTGDLLADAPTLVSYAAPGVYTLSFRVVDTNGVAYTALRTVLIQDMNVQRSMLCDVYGYLKDRLAASDAMGASDVYQPEIRPQYLSLFNAFDTRMSSIVPQLGTITTGFIGTGFAELQLVRDNADQTRNGYPLRMSRGTDGVWRITEM